MVVELRDIHRDLREFVEAAEEAAIAKPLADLEQSANEVGRAWSGSWIGYQARIYYENLTPPPAGAHFSREWGLMPMRSNDTRGAWTEFTAEAVLQEIENRAGNPDLGPAKALAAKGEKLFDEAKAQVISILETVLARRNDSFVGALLEDAKKAELVSGRDYIEYVRPGTFMSRDSMAMTQGLWTPAHVTVLANIVELRSPKQGCERLAGIAQKAASHLERVEREQVRQARIGTNVFIGHGRSLLWKDLKDFIQDRLRLPWDEFNRVPVAGVTNIARLSEVLDAAAVAFIIMTAEDEQADGKMRARMNVIHEVGLFQGRLGFTKAIVLLEDGCEEFTNIQGLGQIRFPQGNIRAAFEEIRLVLEREGVLEVDNR